MPEDPTDTAASVRPDPGAANTTTAPPAPERRFHGWRLLGIIMVVVVVLAVISAIIDWAIIGPLEGRAW